MNRLTRNLLRATAAVLVLPVVAVAAAFGALNTDAGRSFAEGEVASLTGGQVRLTGLSGRFPDHLRLAHLALHDAQGAYLQADAIALDWSPLALLHRQALVHNLEAAQLTLARLPASAPAQPGPAAPGKPFTLPVRVTVEHLAVPQADLAPLPAPLALIASADLPTLQTGTLNLGARRLRPGDGAYTLTGTVTATGIDAHLTADEPQHGLLATLANLPDLGPIHLDATTAGPQSALATTLALTAGPLDARATATLNLDAKTLTADITATAPAMAPGPGVAWRSIALQTHVTGPFTTPDATGHLHVDTLTAAGAGLRMLDADLSGNAGQATLRATATALRIPGPDPALLEAAPVTLQAAIRLDDPARPLTFTLAHPLLTATGTAQVTAKTADATLTLPDLAAFSTLAGTPLAGHTTVKLHGSPTAVDATAALALTAAPGPAPALIGDNATLALSATFAGPNFDVTNLTLDGAALHLTAHGTSGPAGLDLTVHATLPDLTRAAPNLTGNATLDAHVHGPADALALDATLAGPIGAPGIAPTPLRVTAALTGLPASPAGHIAAEGALLGTPVQLALDATRAPDGTLHATLTQAGWRTLHAEADLTLPPGATLPTGHASLRAPHLEDLRPFLNQPIAGALTATIQLDADALTLEAEARNAGLSTAHVAQATLKAHVTTPLATPGITATLALDGIAASGTTGTAHLDATGHLDALALKLGANLVSSGTRATIASTALLAATAKQLRLETLQLSASRATLAPETVRLLAPATLRFADGLSLDRLRLGLRQATLDVSGRLSPTLDATIALRTPADIAAAFAPEATPALAIDGTVSLDARLTGTPALPSGTIRLDARGLRARTGPGRAFPPATITATAQLGSGSARVDAHLTAGSAQLALNGTAPLRASSLGAGPLALRATGALDLALLDPILAADGRRVRGRLALDATIAGTVAAPIIGGTAQLSGGDIQDFTQGVHLTNVAGTLRAEGAVVRTNLTAQAGPGTIAIAGTVGVLAPGLPLDLAITLRNARLLASDTLTASLDANLTLRGPATNGPQAAGHVTIRQAELRIPQSLPVSVVILPVHRPGDRVASAPAPSAPVALDLTIDAPQAIYVRGRGVDAEMSGNLRIQGTSTSPRVGGGLAMRRGSVSVAGTTLNFSRGKIGFDGVGITGKIDPTLDFAAESTSGGVTATLGITGYVSKPVIKLTSVPQLPQDEVLAYLIFKRSAKELGPFQIAQIAAGLAELSDAGAGASLNPLEAVRKGLGLDRLSIGAGGNPAATGKNSTSGSTAPTIEAGRYIANGVYVGAKQGTTGGQTGATVQIDITKGLKVETDVGTGQGGNQVGLTYQYEY